MRNFDEFLKLIREYKDSHNGRCNVPQYYIAPNGCKLGFKVMYVRSIKDKLSADEISQLDDLNFVWIRTKRSKSLPFDEVYSLIKEYMDSHNGFCAIPESYVTDNGIRLGILLSNIKSEGRMLTPEQKELLKSLGISFYNKNVKKHITMDEGIEYVRQYVQKYGDCNVPHKYVTDDGYKLGCFVFNVRYGHRKTTEEEKAVLDSLGFIWPHARYKGGK